jgi:hypothetical protein
MAGGGGRDSGGILSLWELYDEYPEAIEHEFIALGLRWRDVGSKKLSWRDAKIIITEAPVTGAYARAKYPEAHLYERRGFDMILYLLNCLIIKTANTARAKKHDFPPLPEWAQEKEVIGGGKGNALPIDELLEWLAAR